MAEKEYIEREAVNALIEAECSPKVAAFLNHAIDNITAADVRSVMRGKWKYRGQKVIDDLFPTYACSVCHGVIPADWRRKCNFCPNCGARMEES